MRFWSPYLTPSRYRNRDPDRLGVKLFKSTSKRDQVHTRRRGGKAGVVRLECVATTPKLGQIDMGIGISTVTFNSVLVPSG